MSPLRNLKLPPLQDPSQWSSTQEWSLNAISTIKQLQECLSQVPSPDLSDDDVASAVAIAVPLLGDENWSSESIRTVANDVMARLPSPTLQVVSCVLSQHIKPVFLKAQHSLVNPNSGRKLPRAAGGPSAALDFYDDQEWKTFPGISNLLIWCIQHLKGEDYAQVWHLVIPPTMTILDDYESYHKLKGVLIVSELLALVPPALLTRSGIDGLLISSMKATMVHLHSPLTPEILRRSIPLFLRIIEVTTAPRSKARFEQICALIGDGIIGGIWTYASAEWETLEASMAALADALRMLGIGSARYLKAIISQVVHNLTSLPSQRCVALQLASLEVLEVIIKICQARMDAWTGPIVEGLAKAWVSLQDPNFRHSEETKLLQSALQRTCRALSDVYPLVIENEYRRLLECDAPMFRDLLVEDDLH